MGQICSCFFRRHRSPPSGVDVPPPVPPRTSGAMSILDRLKTDRSTHDVSSAPNVPPPMAGPPKQRVVAMYNYDSQVDGDIGFKKGDFMTLCEKTNEDWWYVEHERTHEKGYVPRNFVTLQNSALNQEWYHGQVARREAENLIMAQPRGTFLLRERAETSGVNGYEEFALTLKDSKPDRGEHAKHYKVKRTDDGRYYISARKPMLSLEQLVDMYRKQSDGLGCVLLQACPKISPLVPAPVDWKEMFEVSRQSLMFDKIVGHGNFGEVWSGSLTIKGKTTNVAIKTLKTGTMESDAFLEEAKIMKSCDHPRLVKLLAICSQEEPLCIITEFMQNKSLLTYMREGRGKNLDVHGQVDIAHQVAHGMWYLESKNYIHRDLAARNVLVGREFGNVPEVKIADFGLARILTTSDIYNPQERSKFPVKWTAPEAAIRFQFTIKSDVWSYGVLLFEIMTKGEHPYNGMVNAHVLNEVEKGYRLPRPQNCPVEIYDMMKKCWEKDPDRRPTFEFLYTYFEDYFVSSQDSYQGDQNGI